MKTVNQEYMKQIKAVYDDKLGIYHLSNGSRVTEESVSQMRLSTLREYVNTLINKKP